MNRITVLDKGYIKLLDSMGNDLTVVNSAKISKGNRSSDLSEKDKNLIENLAKWNHWTPFSHVTIHLDIKMPITNGYEVCKKIREIDLKVPIIIQTAHVLVGEKEFALKAGATEYLTKPLRSNILLKTIKKYLE